MSSSSSSAVAPAILGPNRYGKGKVKLLRVYRTPGRHEVHELEVTCLLTGDFESAFLQGTNEKILPTDTVKNTVLAFSKKVNVDPVEEYGLALCQHFLSTQKQVDAVDITLERRIWDRLSDAKGVEHEHCFQGGSDMVAGATVSQRRGEDAQVVSFVRDWRVMKTTNTGFVGFIKDPYTTLPEATDRIMCTKVQGEWSFCPKAVAKTGKERVDFKGVRATVMRAFQDEFTGPAPGGVFSESVQKTLFDMGARVIREVPSVTNVYLNLPNLHYFTVPLEKLGMENNMEVFYPAYEPHGIITANVQRNPKARM